ncbi:MAG: hypothetical protein AAGB46_17280 [Verrucomicrobiota bacterium]
MIIELVRLRRWEEGRKKSGNKVEGRVSLPVFYAKGFGWTMRMKMDDRGVPLVEFGIQSGLGGLAVVGLKSNLLEAKRWRG